MARKITGTFCERTENPKSKFDGRSFRWKKSGRSWVLVGCPKGKWNAKKARCKVGTRAHKILARASARCRVGRRVKK
jgi:hypothetical protein